MGCYTTAFQTVRKTVGAPWLMLWTCALDEPFRQLSGRPLGGAFPVARGSRAIIRARNSHNLFSNVFR